LVKSYLIQCKYHSFYKFIFIEKVFVKDLINCEFSKQYLQNT